MTPARRAAKTAAVAVATLAASALFAPSIAPREALAEEPAGAAEARQRARAILAEEAFQTELPADKEAPESDPRANPPWQRPSRDAADIPAPPSALAAVARVALYALAAAALVIGCLSVAQRSRRGELDQAAAVRAPAATSGGRPGADASIERAEALALEGRYDEAVHALLLAALGRLDLRGHVALNPAMTSREILARSRLEGAAREALRELVLAVELSLFGGLGADEGDYERCAAAYKGFSASLSAHARKA
ncbi:DUF4129 domain-containing protein [Sorangium sp. So ce1128]